MTKTIPVSAHTRKVEKPSAYIDKHLALMSSEEDRIRFAQMHGLEIANDAEPRREGIIERFMPWFRRRK